jgi:hypothetical protein
LRERAAPKAFWISLAEEQLLLKLLGAKEYLHVQLGQNNSHTMFIFFLHEHSPKGGTPCGRIGQPPGSPHRPATSAFQTRDSSRDRLTTDMTQILI